MILGPKDFVGVGFRSVVACERHFTGVHPNRGVLFILAVFGVGFHAVFKRSVERVRFQLCGDFKLSLGVQSGYQNAVYFPSGLVIQHVSNIEGGAVGVRFVHEHLNRLLNTGRHEHTCAVKREGGSADLGRVNHGRVLGHMEADLDLTWREGVRAVGHDDELEVAVATAGCIENIGIVTDRPLEVDFDVVPVFNDHRDELGVVRNISVLRTVDFHFNEVLAERWRPSDVAAALKLEGFFSAAEEGVGGEWIGRRRIGKR